MSILNSQLKFVKGDVRDINFLRKVFNKEKLLGNIIKYVIHFWNPYYDNFIHFTPGSKAPPYQTKKILPICQ